LRKDLPLLLQKRPIEKTLFVLVASDKGLAGAFNGSVFKKFESIFQNIVPEQAVFAAVGEKSYHYLSKKGLPIVKKITHIGDFTTPEEVKPLADFLVAGYLEKTWDSVVIVSTHFRSALKQESLSQQILPINFDAIQSTVKEIIPDKGKFAELMKEQDLHFIPKKGKKPSYLIEPSVKKVLENLVRHLFFMQVYHIILEANAAEHAARRMAMKTAFDNASDLSGALNLQYNKSRQGEITKQIIEIIAGAESLS
jgi:F-type H+-transporting ATPase subunit gamma